MQGTQSNQSFERIIRTRPTSGKHEQQPSRPGKQWTRTDKRQFSQQ